MTELKVLEKEWSSKNKYPLKHYGRSSHFKGIWEHICECGEKHEWGAYIKNRTEKGVGCPICSGRGRVEICYCKSLEYKYPNLALEWHSKNKITPDKITPGSGKRFWWICFKSVCHHKHEWETILSHRTGNNAGCPYCSGMKTCECKSLAVLRPKLALEWSDKNTIKPNEISFGSHYKAIWLCPNGHEYQSPVHFRTRPKQPSNCPICNESKGEKHIAELLENLKISYIRQKTFSYMGRKNFRFDFYLPELNKAIEFDGGQHFEARDFFEGEDGLAKTKIRDAIKNLYCSENGISLLRIHYKDKDSIEEMLDVFLVKFSFVCLMLSESYP
jgi:very-short-patch-repair endonuclease